MILTYILNHDFKILSFIFIFNKDFKSLDCFNVYNIYHLFFRGAFQKVILIIKILFVINILNGLLKFHSFIITYFLNII